MPVAVVLVVMAISMVPIKCMVSHWSMVSKSVLTKAMINAVLSMSFVCLSNTMGISIEPVAILEPMWVMLLKTKWMVALPPVWSVVMVNTSMVLNWSTVMG